MQTVNKIHTWVELSGMDLGSLETIAPCKRGPLGCLMSSTAYNHSKGCALGTRASVLTRSWISQTSDLGKIHFCCLRVLRSLWDYDMKTQTDQDSVPMPGPLAGKRTNVTESVFTTWGVTHHLDITRAFAVTIKRARVQNMQTTPYLNGYRKQSMHGNEERW